MYLATSADRIADVLELDHMQKEVYAYVPVAALHSQSPADIPFSRSAAPRWP